MLRRFLIVIPLAALLAAQTGHEVRFESRFENEQASVTTLELPPGGFARLFQNATHDVIWVALADGEASFARSGRDKVAAPLRAGDVRLFRSYEIASVSNPGVEPLRA